MKNDVINKMIIGSGDSASPFESISAHVTFVDRALAGVVINIDEEIDEAIEAWHLGGSGVALHEWLGLTRDEYNLFATKPSMLREILAARKLLEVPVKKNNDHNIIGALSGLMPNSYEASSTGGAPADPYEGVKVASKPEPIEISGNLLESDATYIVHQTNCVTYNVAGLAANIFKKFPYADVYTNRKDVFSGSISSDKPGTIIVRGDGVKDRYVVALMGQLLPGKAHQSDDTNDLRKIYFHEGLIKLFHRLRDGESVVFPYGIGCGLAGGKWEDYLFMIRAFTSLCAQKNCKVFIVKPEFLKG